MTRGVFFGGGPRLLPILPFGRQDRRSKRPFSAASDYEIRREALIGRDPFWNHHNLFEPRLEKLKISHYNHSIFEKEERPSPTPCAPAVIALYQHQHSVISPMTSPQLSQPIPSTHLPPTPSTPPPKTHRELKPSSSAHPAFRHQVPILPPLA